MDENEIICACMGTTEEVQAATQAGTVCGACLPELEALIEKLANK